MRTKTALIIAASVWTASALYSTVSAEETTARSVVEGVYTEEQATRGQAVYKTTCETCHGPELKGDVGPPLTAMNLVAHWKTQTLGELYLKIRDEMPPGQRAKLTAQEAADVLAYVLQSDRFPAGSAELATGEAALKEIRIEAPPRQP